MVKYPFNTIEPKWQKYWEEHKTFKVTEDANIPKDKRKYVLDMFPYPSAQGLHVGHPEGYTATDIYCRYLRMNGYNVLHPMGFDSFGLPAENYAIKMGVHPAKITAENIDHFRRQIKAMGFSYDWDREVATSDVDYYKWTQWIFLKLFEKGLAYEAESPINWCPSCKTGLANEEVVEGLCERCKTRVTRKRIRQWVLKITAYAQRLLDDLDGLDWPEPVKQMQRNWIGRSEGANVIFKIDGHAESTLEIYTTRPDTLFGATYMVLAPEHPLVEKITTAEQKSQVADYLEASAKKSDLERTDLAKEKTGVFSGAYAINPVNDKKIPIWIADYVLISYGTGAIMAVPAHDERDWEFAKVFNLPIIQVVSEEMGNGERGIGNREWGEEKQHGENIQGLDGLAGSSESGRDDLSANEKLSEGGNVRSDQPNQASSCINSGQYSRGQWKGQPEGISSVLVNSERLIEGTGNTYTDSGTTQLSDKGSIKTVAGSTPISRSSADCLEKISQETITSPLPTPHSPYIADGFSVNSGLLNGLPTEEAKKRITEWLEERGLGKRAVNFKLRDWLFSRQRYWGEPIPVVHCKNCAANNTQAANNNPADGKNAGIVPLSEKDLPLKLPDVQSYTPTGTGESPLAAIDEWVNTSCPRCGGPALRETNTMPQWAGSCWYYLRYLDPQNSDCFASRDKIDYWAPVDLYVGGVEHAVLHLLYARFWHKVLYDFGLVNTKEPFQRLVNQGMITSFAYQRKDKTLVPTDQVEKQSGGHFIEKATGEEVTEVIAKMSKSLKNIINPDEIVREYGADSLRVYEMFMGPLEVSKPWNTAGLVGITRFLERLWALGEKVSAKADGATDELNRLLHKTIKKVSNDTATLNFNTAISAMMIYSNALAKPDSIPATLWEPLVKMLSCYAPHLGEELWEKLGHKSSVSKEPWPEWDEELCTESEVTIVVQINGKIRDKFTAPAGTAKEELEAKAKALPNVQKWLEGSAVLKTITVPDKLVNIVVR